VSGTLVECATRVASDRCSTKTPGGRHRGKEEYSTQSSVYRFVKCCRSQPPAVGRGVVVVVVGVDVGGSVEVAGGVMVRPDSER
jgi:hypothetical protein